MIKPPTLLYALTAAALTACSPQADTTANKQAGDEMAGMDAGRSAMSMGGMMAPAPGDAVSTRAYKQSMQAMIQDMPAYTGEPDVDFMQQMRVHHQAAITMSEAQLEYGKDEAARALAQKIIGDQRAEIAQIDSWLAERKPKT